MTDLDAAGLKLVEVGGCPSCGCVLPDLKASLDARDEIIATLQEDNVNLERELRSKRATISRMTSDQYRLLRESPLFDDATEVLDHWQKILSPKAREPYNRPRLEAVIARLQGGYDKAALKQAIHGYAMHPYMVNGRRCAHGTPDDWKADAELIFRDAAHVDRGLASCEQALSAGRAVDAMGRSNLSITPSPHSGQLNELGEAAVILAELAHWYVFPCVANGKEPATRHGFLDATLDTERIRACWSKYPDLNVAIRTGAESGVIVLDVDIRHGGGSSLGELVIGKEPIPKTLTIKTPGGGVHYYFQHPGVEIRNSTGLLGPGLDVRGDGGYVLAPPSRNGNGRNYEVEVRTPRVALPQWLLTELVTRQARIDKALANGEYEILMTSGASEGTRNNRLMSLVGHLVAKGHNYRDTYAISVAMNEKYCSPPVLSKEVEKIVKSKINMDARKALR